MQHGTPVDHEDHAGETALTVATQRGDLKAIGVLLQHGARIDRESKNGGFTALSRSVDFSQTSAIAALATCGAQLDYETEAGETALVHAAKAGNVSSIAALARAGAIVDIQVCTGRMGGNVGGRGEQVRERISLRTCQWAGSA